MRPGSIKEYVVRIVFGFLLCTSPGSAAEPTPQRSLLALSKSDHTLAVVDPGTLKVVARMPVGQDPHEAISMLAEDRTDWAGRSDSSPRRPRG